jgi:hypothetical protein
MLWANNSALDLPALLSHFFAPSIADAGGVPRGARERSDTV